MQKIISVRYYAEFLAGFEKFYFLQWCNLNNPVFTNNMNKDTRISYLHLLVWLYLNLYELNQSTYFITLSFLSKHCIKGTANSFIYEYICRLVPHLILLAMNEQLFSEEKEGKILVWYLLLNYWSIMKYSCNQCLVNLKSI